MITSSTSIGGMPTDKLPTGTALKEKPGSNVDFCTLLFALIGTFEIVRGCVDKSASVEGSGRFSTWVIDMDDIFVLICKSSEIPTCISVALFLLGVLKTRIGMFSSPGCETLKKKLY